jgi:hypothetical protein
MPTALSLTLLIGETIPKPVPTVFTQSLESLEVTHQLEGRSGFQIVFRAGRSEAEGLQDDVVLNSPLLHPFNRVIVTLFFQSLPHVLLDGIITRQEFSPGDIPGEARLTITGEDVSVMMDLEEKSVEHTALHDSAIVSKLLLGYAKYGLVPKVLQPQVSEAPLPTQRTPVQLSTDLEHIRELATRNGFVFYVTPGPVVGTNTAYWGPLIKQGEVPLKQLTCNMGSFTNVTSITAQYDALAPTQVKGRAQDGKTNEIQTLLKQSSRRSPLSALPALTHQSRVRVTQFRESGRSRTVADARAQAVLDRSTDAVVTVTGELDALTYGDLLQAGKVVSLRGLGLTYDGKYVVSQVTHRINVGDPEGDYQQRFTLIREGTKSQV